MARKKKGLVIQFRIGFGPGDLEKVVAENDELLAQYYVQRERYVARAIDRDDNVSVFIGPKGIGKSAILQMVRLGQQATGDGARVVEITPDDLAFNALVNIDAKTPLLETPNQNRWLFKSLWDYVLCSELLWKEACPVDGVAGVLTRLFGTKHKKEQQQLRRLTLSDDGRASSMTDKMLELVSEVAVEAGYGDATINATAKLDHPATRPANDLRLLQLINNVARNIEDALTHEYYILVDDLDHYWKGTELQNAFLGAMFESIWQLSRARKIKFVVALRKNIYREISIEEGDKFEEFVKEVAWTKAAVLLMVQKRISTVVNVAETKVFGTLFPADGFEQIWDATDGTPREVLRLAAECVVHATDNNHSSVEQSDILEAVQKFSERLLDNLYSAWRFQYPEMRFVALRFAGGAKEFDVNVVQEVAFTIADAVENRLTNDIPWATRGVDRPLDFAQVILRVGFLQLKDGRTSRPRTPTEDDLLMLKDSNWFAIHPRYEAGLQLVGVR